MRTVGSILKDAREDKLYSIEEVEKATKIRKELLIALENDDYSKLPPSTFIQGFIKNYAKFLDLDGEKMMAVFRREFPAKRHKPYIMDAFTKPVEKNKLRITPGKILGVAVGVVILTFFAYLWLQYRSLVGAPPLVVSSPQDQMTTDNPVVAVEGRTDPEVKVLINNQEVPVSVEGNFKEEINLVAPVNKINIMAVSKFGQKISLEKTVYLKR